MSKKKYVLIAEDDKNYSKIFAAKFTQAGYEVLVVGDGQQALDEIARRIPDMILLDIMMPVKNGFETLKEIRADKKFDKVKVIVVSSLGQEADMERARGLGATDYFIKADSSLSDLMERINKYLE
jgi:DNA-binding response OmpR family regulator